MGSAFLQRDSSTNRIHVHQQEPSYQRTEVQNWGPIQRTTLLISGVLHTLPRSQKSSWYPIHYMQAIQSMPRIWNQGFWSAFSCGYCVKFYHDVTQSPVYQIMKTHKVPLLELIVFTDASRKDWLPRHRTIHGRWICLLPRWIHPCKVTCTNLSHNVFWKGRKHVFVLRRKHGRSTHMDAALWLQTPGHRTLQQIQSNVHYSPKHSHGGQSGSCANEHEWSAYQTDATHLMMIPLCERCQTKTTQTVLDSKRR